MNRVYCDVVRQVARDDYAVYLFERNANERTPLRVSNGRLEADLSVGEHSELPVTLVLTEPQLDALRGRQEARMMSR